MSKLIFLITCTLMLSCIGQSQSLNNEVLLNSGSPILLGKVNKEGFTHANYRDWFLAQYSTYKTEDSLINIFSEDLKDYQITVFMGTWCGDSRREVPRLYKILEVSGFPMTQLSVIALSSQPPLYKQSPDHEETGLNIHRVPTFIFYKDDKEINRIVESPKVSIEDDILNIISEKYEPKYMAVNILYKIMESENYKEKIKASFDTIKEVVVSMYELNTYAKILLNEDQAKAKEVLKLNTELFPDKSATFVNFAKVLYNNKDLEAALSNYIKALQLKPDEKIIKVKIEHLKNEIERNSNNN